jgi:hypothetical protein
MIDLNNPDQRNGEKAAKLSLGRLLPAAQFLIGF